VADSLGSSDLKVTLTGSEGDIDLNYIADQAAGRLGIPHTYQDLDGSDHLSFLFPFFVANDLNLYWDTDLDVPRGLGSTNTMLVYSQPLTIYDAPNGPVHGRIHTILDSTTAVHQGTWIDEEDLENQAQVYALMTIYAGMAIQEPNYDYLPYIIFLLSVTAVIAYFILRRSRLDT
jgi:hypothetical protein